MKYRTKFSNFLVCFFSFSFFSAFDFFFFFYLTKLFLGAFYDFNVISYTGRQKVKKSLISIPREERKERGLFSEQRLVIEPCVEMVVPSAT